MHTVLAVLGWVSAVVVFLVVCVFIGAMNDARKFKKHKVIVLEILGADGGELFGLEIVERSKGLVSRNVIYVWLDRLEDQGLIVSRYVPSYLEDKAAVQDANARAIFDDVDPAYPRRRLYRLKREAA